MLYLFEDVEQFSVVKTKFLVIEAENEEDACYKLNTYGRICGIESSIPIIGPPLDTVEYKSINQHHPEVDLDFFGVE